VASSRGFKALLDMSGRSWTARRVLHNSRLQVRFLSNLPSQTLNSWRLQPRGVQPVLWCFDPA
jgi:hypothetical protein